jgi:hypothetical protein
VTVNNKRALLATNSGGTGSTSHAWPRFNHFFKASGTQTTIASLNYDPASDTVNGLDSVSLIRD